MSWFNSVVAGGGGQGGNYMLNQAGTYAGNGGLDWVSQLGFGGSSGSTSPFSADGFSNMYNDTFGFINAMLRGSGINVDAGGGMASARDLLGPELYSEFVNTNDMPGTQGYTSTSEDFIRNNPGILDLYHEERAAQASEGSTQV